ncbi:Fpg/Nei family DNA glycosylase [Cohnella soli]|uniref:Fpg/Nei family DNA glycosylase n=1 Tax=Cohnella soli TaxID=425005 RepID=A0ABW0HT00_9BACL
MPEIPEIEYYRTKLSEGLCGRSITDVAVAKPATVNETPEVFGEALKGRVLLFVERKGKMILFHLDDGYRLVMTLSADSRVQYGDLSSDTEGVRVDIALTFDDGKSLRLSGMKAAYVHRMTAKAAIELMKQNGPDALDSRLTLEVFAKRLAGKKGKLKTTLTDQRFVAGIGSMYADEIAFAAGIHPGTPVSALSSEQTEKLYRAMRDVLAEAADKGGCVLHPMTTNDDDIAGGYRKYLKVHGRAGENCFTCGTPIRMETTAGRKMEFCPSCQDTVG